MLLWKKWGLFALIFAFVLLLDQISKTWVLANMAYGESLRPIPALYPYFQITRSSNTGAAFGIFPEGGVAFLVVAVIVSSILLYYYAQSAQEARLMRVGLSLVVAGALGNVIDRLQHGYVVDFVHLTLPGVISNVSNFADHAIVLGVLCLMIDSLRPQKPAQAPVDV
jgi:signal peptidase II